METILYFGGLCMYYGAQWLISVLLVRFGSYEQAGVYSLAMSVSNIFMPVATYGIRQYQVSDIKKEYSDNTYILSRKMSILASLVLCIIYIAAMGYNSLYISVILAFFAFKLIEAYEDVFNGVSQREGHMWVSGVSMIIRGLAIVAVFFAVYLIKPALFMMTALCAAAVLIVLLAFDETLAKKQSGYKLTYNKKEFQKAQHLLNIGFVLMLYSVFNASFTSIVKIILERLVDATMLGYYSSVSAPTTVIPLFAAALLVPLMPKIAEKYQSCDAKGMLGLFAKTSFIMLGIGAAGLVFSKILGIWFLNLLFGKEILKYFTLLYWVVIAVTLVALNNVCASFLTAARKLTQLMIFAFIGCAVQVGVSFPLIRAFSIYGAAWALIVSAGIQLICELIYIFITAEKMKSSKINEITDEVNDDGTE